MKLFLVGLIGIVLFVCALFGGLHVGTACPSDAKDFAAHIKQQGHLEEWGGIENAVKFLQGIADGTSEFRVYGDGVKTIIAVSRGPAGSGMVIYGSGVMPTGFPATTDSIIAKTRGMTMRTGNADINAARTTAGCFGEKLQSQTAGVSAPSVSVPVNGPAIIGIGAAALLVGFFALSRRGSVTA